MVTPILIHFNISPILINLCKGQGYISCAELRTILTELGEFMDPNEVQLLFFKSSQEIHISFFFVIFLD